MGRLAHKITDGLPELAWQIMTAGFRERKTYRAISDELLAAGFQVPERTVARRAIEWRGEQRRSDMVATLGRAGVLAPSWTLAELIGILETLDLAPGYQLRSRRRVEKAVANFLANSNQDSVEALEKELLRFRLQSISSQKLEPTGGGQ
jgi:hypothetical protein